MIPDPIPEAASWWRRVQETAVSISRVIEARKLKSNEVPIVLGMLVRRLAEFCKLPVETVLDMLYQATTQNMERAPEAPRHVRLLAVIREMETVHGGMHSPASVRAKVSFYGKTEDATCETPVWINITDLVHAGFQPTGTASRYAMTVSFRPLAPNDPADY